TPFESAIDRAFTGIQIRDWLTAAAALDQANAEDPGVFAANNFSYLRGRVAENQGDWRRALEEFRKVGFGNPLYAASLWHAARASAKLGDEPATLEALALLPRNFPQELKIQLAKETGGNVALKLYQDLSTRE